MPGRPKGQTALLMASVDDVEAQFYEALQQGDIDRLMAVWSEDDDVMCVSPGGPRLHGHAAIRNAFEALFGNGPVRVHLEQVRRLDSPGCVVHSVVQRVELPMAEGPATAWVVATNVYWKTALGWRMVVHHASPGSAETVPDLADAPTTLH